MNRNGRKHVHGLGRLALVGACAILACSCAKQEAADDVPVIGMGKEGQSIIRYVPQSRLLKHVAPMLGKTVDLTTEKLEKYEANPNFNLSRVSVGIELDPAFGVHVGAIETTIGLEAQVELRLEHLPLPGEPIKIGF